MQETVGSSTAMRSEERSVDKDDGGVGDGGGGDGGVGEDGGVGDGGGGDDGGVGGDDDGGGGDGDTSGFLNSNRCSDRTRPSPYNLQARGSKIREEFLHVITQKAQDTKI
jgi:hypothetical protein